MTAVVIAVVALLVSLASLVLPLLLLTDSCWREIEDGMRYQPW